jgi:D-alanyl-lipoteichoic acid acyltransferase DltB (MBOAT superfamily)
MLFTSYAFIGFAAVCIAAYYAVPKKIQWMLLLIFSYIYYGIASPRGLVYILTTTVSVYLTACLIDKKAEEQKQYLKLHKEELSQDEKKAYKRKQKQGRTRWMAACIVLNIGILALVKYMQFFLENINAILSAAGRTGGLSFVTLAVPMGISFYTFQSISYLIDVNRGTVRAEKNIFKLALFVSFFPQIVQGPISRFGDLSQTLYEEHPFDAKTVSYGLQRVLWGFFKKLVVADRILAAVTTIIGDLPTYQGAYAFVGMIFYTLQLYADFTGGIDITIGLAQTLGIRVQENFIRPYFSKSLKEYWRRWHITMCSWFRDYIFYPVSSGKALQKLSRFTRKHFGDGLGKRLPVYVASFVVWFTTGIWHGASWNFIVWGLANWLVLMLSQELEPLYARFHQRFHLENRSFYRLFQVVRTFLLVCVLNMFDCYSSIAETMKAFGSMFTASNWHILWDGSLLTLGINGLDYAILAVAVAVMLLVSLAGRGCSVRDKIAARPYPVRFVVWFGLFLTVLLVGAYGIGYDSSQFIYNRF